MGHRHFGFLSIHTFVLATALLCARELRAENKVKSEFLGFTADAGGFYYREESTLDDGPEPENSNKVWFVEIVKGAKSSSSVSARDVTTEFNAKEPSLTSSSALDTKDNRPWDDDWNIQFSLEPLKKAKAVGGPEYLLAVREPGAKAFQAAARGKLNAVHDVKGVDKVYRFKDSTLYVAAVRYFDNNILEAESVHYVAVELNSAIAATLRASAAALVKKKNFPEATKVFEKSLTLDGENSEALFQLARLAALSDNQGEAFAKASHAIAVEPKLKKRIRGDKAFKKLLKDKQFKELLR